MLKCSYCKKKSSPSRINKILTIIHAFCHNESALSCSKRLNLSYVSVQGYYIDFRSACGKICDYEHTLVRNSSCKYEEYFYLEHTKKKETKAVFDAHIFLSFDYNGHIYNILMPTFKKYKHQFLEDKLEDMYSNEFSHFKQNNHIINVNKNYSTLEIFWIFFEKSILHYKGVSHESFLPYLKEIEFKFNHVPTQQKDLLQKFYFKEKSP